MIIKKSEHLLLLIFLALVGIILQDAVAADLPAGVPNPIGPDGKYTHALFFTTKAYQNEALKLVIQEASQVAKKLQLPEELPITKSNIVKAFINPFGYAYAKGAIGNVTTKNYVYYVSQGDKFSYLESPHQDEICQKFEMSYTLSANQINTNEALKLAAKWLKAIPVDVESLNRDCSVKVELDNAYVHPPFGKIVPVYYVSWVEKSSGGSMASVRLFSPTKMLLQLRVENPKYVLRMPLQVTNLVSLLKTNNATE